MRNGFVIDIPKCKGCGCNVQPFSGRVFCTNECREKWYSSEQVRLRRAHSNPQELDNQVCQHCGTHFNGHKRKFCCVKCREASQKKKNERQCERCGEMFVALRANKCRACRQYLDRQRASRSAALRYKTQQTGQLTLSKTAAVGGIAEKMFEIVCMRHGWLVCKPDADGNPAFDRIIYRSGLYERVQIKGISGNRFDFGTDWQFGGGIVRMNLNAIDTVAVVDVDSGFMWLVPKERIARNFYPSNYLDCEHHCLGDHMTMCHTPDGGGRP